MRIRRFAWVAACASTLLAGCTQLSSARAVPEHQLSRLSALLPADALLLGEQHDATEHQQLQRQVVEWLAGSRRLAAVAIEMAPSGQNTSELAHTASESQVRAALNWNEAGWPWNLYGPVVMAAVRAGVPVIGANLPAAQQRDAMQDKTLDQRLPPGAFAIQKQRIRKGHCDLLPEAQILPMTRIQIARDISMARSIEQAIRPGRTVLLIAGNQHVERELGVPAHLPQKISVKIISAKAGASPTMTSDGQDNLRSPGVDIIWPTAALPAKDYCAQIRLTRGAGTSAPGSTSDQPERRP